MKNTYTLAIVRDYDIKALALPLMTLAQAESHAYRLRKLSPKSHVVVINKESI